MNKLATVSALAALAMGGQAAMAEDFSYRYFDGNLILAETPGSDGKGLGFNASTDIPNLYPNATGFGGVRFIDFDGGNQLQAEGGLGFHWPIVSVVDFTGGLALGLNRWSVSGGGSDTDIGFTLNAGVRARPFIEQLELNGGLKHVDIGPAADDTFVVLGARYAFRPGMSGGIQLESGDIDYFTLSLRWEM